MSRSFSFFTLFLIILLIGLGTWQIQRKAEKETLLKDLSQSQQTAPQDIDTLQNLNTFTPAYAIGHFLPEESIFIQSKTYKGQSGVYVFNVFQTKQGHHLLVQRGWSKDEIKSIPSGELKIEGIARHPSKPNMFQPHNTPPTYFWVDLKQLSQNLQQSLFPFYLVLKDPLNPHILPTDPIPLPRNSHLEYAITWYFLAFLIGIMFVWKNKFFRKESPS